MDQQCNPIQLLFCIINRNRKSMYEESRVAAWLVFVLRSLIKSLILFI